MPDDDLNRRMDEMLRDYARQRRNIPEPQMHPATRNMLQGEVARVYKEKQQDGKGAGAKRGLLRFWPQYAIGMAAVLVLLGILVPEQLRQRKAASQKPAAQTRALADKEVEELKVPTQMSAESNVKKENEVPQKTDSKDRLEDLKEAQAGRADTRRVQPLPAAAAPSRSVQLGLEVRQGERNRAENDVALNEPVLKQQTPAEGPAQPDQRGYFNKPPVAAQDELAREKLAKADTAAAPAAGDKRFSTPLNLKRAAELTNLGGALRSQFVQVTTNQSVAGGALAAGRPVVLSSFQLEQLGENLKFIDRDGSVYDGQVLTNAPSDADKNANTAEAKIRPAFSQATATATAQQPQAYFLDNSLVNDFRVSGMNRTLGKSVVVTGKLYERTNQSQAAQNTLNYQTQNRQPLATPALQAGTQVNQLNQLSVANRAIVGTATIDDTNQVPIQAISNE